MVFVYGTSGTKEENDWSYNKARYDAETWYYRGNGAVDMIADKNAIAEARRLNIPVVAIVDTNANPVLADFVIPANDDALKGLQLITDYVAQAIAEGKAARKTEEKS